MFNLYRICETKNDCCRGISSTGWNEWVDWRWACKGSCRDAWKRTLERVDWKDASNRLKDYLYVNGEPQITDDITLERLPSLLNAELLGPNASKIGTIADFNFNSVTGKILYYLVSRSDPRIPGSSRWRLNIDRIYDQQPGLVFTNISNLDEIPLIKSSLRQDFLRKSKKFKYQFEDLVIKQVIN